MIHDKAFHDELKRTADEMMRGEHPEYNQANACVCRVGITLKKLGVDIWQAKDTYDWLQNFQRKNYSQPLDDMYSTVGSGAKNQEKGAEGIYEYLKAIEYV